MKSSLSHIRLGAKNLNGKFLANVCPNHYHGKPHRKITGLKNRKPSVWRLCDWNLAKRMVMSIKVKPQRSILKRASRESG